MKCGEIMKDLIKKILNKVFRVFKVRNKIIFESGFNLIDGCPFAIYKYMVDKNIEDYRLIWIVKRGTNVSKIREHDYVYYNTLKAFYHLATAKYWIKSQSTKNIIDKRDEQSYIQVWHGNGILKKMGYDVTKENSNVPMAHTREWDFFVAHSDSDAKKIKSSTGYNGKYVVIGSANMDYIIKNKNNKGLKKEVFNKLNCGDFKKKVLLYAPTFRDYELEENIVELPIKSLLNLDNYIVLIRVHPLVRKNLNKDIFDNDNFINACDYSNIEDLLVISDVLVTDYSSVSFQFAVLNRPIVFYPYDYDKYVGCRDGFYVDYKKELPGPLCYSEEQLVEVLKDYSSLEKKYKNKLIAFNKNFNKFADGHACERFVANLLKGKFDK